MAIKLQRTYGGIMLDKPKNRWVIFEAEPHVCIKIKSVFPKLSVTQTTFSFENSPENCLELSWFMDRYPLDISESDLRVLKRKKQIHIGTLNEMARILMPDYHAPDKIELNEGEHARDYQIVGRDLFLKCKRLLIGDDTGLGKTAIAVFSALVPGTTPAFVCMQTHMPAQWEAQINKFTKLKVHIIKTGPVYSLPKADIYLITYSKLAKWVSVFTKEFFRMGVFDEVQELRHNDSQKYAAAKKIADSCEFVLGLTATPIYNYGDEIFHILDLIKSSCLGKKEEFLREWSTGYYGSGKKIKIKDPSALGAYLRETFLFLRRTRQDVKRELPAVNTIIHTVGYDSSEVKKAEDIARELAQKTISGSFVERGQAARELDVFLRMKTGVAKAREVAQYVRILLDNNEPIILAGWHRDVYEIWLDELKEYGPVMFTGSENATQKQATINKFISGQTNVLILSLRSGVGIDGLQHRCSTVVFGELDWSPQVHYQVVSRVDRGGQDAPVTAIYLVTDYGSDPTIIELNGIKASMSKAIIDPFKQHLLENHSDESRITQLAKQFLERRKEH